jgi:hypothetical protein
MGRERERAREITVHKTGDTKGEQEIEREREREKLKKRRR